MDRSSAKRLSAFLVSIVACLVFLGSSALTAAEAAGKASHIATPRVKHSLKRGTSPTLRSLPKPDRPAARAPHALPTHSRPAVPGATRGRDSVVQRQAGTSSPTGFTNFDGLSAQDDSDVLGFAVAPSDPSADVGSGKLVQVVNSVFEVFDLNGGELFGPFATTSIFTGFGGPCEDLSAVDTVVRYDEIAGRWVLTYLPIDFFGPQTGFHTCMAVSQSADPAGAWNLYDYDFDVLTTNPRLGVWPDGYYLSFDAVDPITFGPLGAAVVAFDRAAMLAGNEANAVGFSLGDFAGLVVSDLDGGTPPPVGAPNHMAAPGQSAWDGSPAPVLHMFDFHADFEDPESSTIFGPFDVPVPDFNPDLCGFASNCIPELDGDSVNPTAGVLMLGMQYRNYGTHESMVVSQTVNVAEGGDLAGIRFYEVRTAPTAQGGEPLPFTLFQAGTYSPSETNRFVPSIASDVSGNMLMGYSISDAASHPAIGLAGRLVGDPLGEMGAESILIAGGGSQQNTGPYWGNYTSMTVDPADGCTFWYTNQYYPADGSFAWVTRVGSFKFGSCTAGPSGTIEGTVTDGANPLEGATVQAGVSSTSTDAAGHYELTLPVGTYDMVVTKYGFFPATADDVEVTVDATTTQDFTLEEAPSVPVNGTVRDSQRGWPLYAQVDVTGPGAPHVQTFSDPVTGYYDVGSLVEGITYTFVVKALTPGYETGGGTLPLGVPLGNAPFLVKNWLLDADLETCNAPGYTPDISGLFENFDGGVLPAGWTVINDSTGGNGMPTEWVVVEGSDPCGDYSGNMTGGTGPFAVSNSDCPGFDVVMDTQLITPSVNFSGLSLATIRFNQDYRALGDNADVDVSIDGGTSWTNVLAQTSDARGPRQTTIDISGLAAGEADVKARFHNYNAAFAWWWQVDNILLGSAGCLAGTGGLVVGTVEDVSTGTLLAGATVENIGGGSTTTKDYTPSWTGDSPLYILYAEAGPQDFVASLANYADDSDSTLVVPNSAVRLDFQLLSGNIAVAPTALNGRVNPGGTDQQELTITNTGAAEASFELRELNAPLLNSLTRGFASESVRQQALARLPQGVKGPEHTARSTQGLAPLPNRRPSAPRVAASVGDVISSFDSGITFGWGVATDFGSHIWLTNLGVAGGDDHDYQYNGDGSQTGNTIDLAGIGEWAGDGALDITTGNLWNVSVGGDNCIYELNPTTLEQTGNTICGSPWTGISQRGLAYDAGNDAFFIGGWNEGVVYHFDRDGNTLDSSFVAIAISGLAYSSENGHLLVMRNDVAGDDVTILDALDNYNPIGAFQVMDGGSPVFADFEQAGIEFDCNGSLWAVNQATQVVYQIESGETVSCESDIPWFSVDPKEGTVPANGGTFPVAANWDAGSLLPGLQQAQLTVTTDTPHQVPAIPVTLTVRFLDVPDDNQFEAYIYGVAGAGIMFGGPPVCAPGVLYFCPDGNVTRADMAGYLWRAINGRNTPPPVYQNIFNDVTFNSYNSFYIQGIYDLGVTAGCGDGTNYCPNVPVTRAQMSALVWRGQNGDEPPPSCSGVFDDVPCPSLYADYIEALFNEGVVVGCGNNNFCPHQPISNGQMSVFLAKAFGIPVLLP